MRRVFFGEFFVVRGGWGEEEGGGRGGSERQGGEAAEGIKAGVREGRRGGRGLWHPFNSELPITHLLLRAIRLPPPAPPSPSPLLQVAEDECRHFLLLEGRLKGVGSRYGALPAHDGLWESASHTSHRFGQVTLSTNGTLMYVVRHYRCRIRVGEHPCLLINHFPACSLPPAPCSLPARLAVESCVHEARGLDVLPATIHKVPGGFDAWGGGIP